MTLKRRMRDRLIIIEIRLALDFNSNRSDNGPIRRSDSQNRIILMRRDSYLKRDAGVGLLLAPRRALALINLDSGFAAENGGVLPVRRRQRVRARNGE